MKIKSLLLGSAAAMVAVTGAQAADAIVVEPEPVEYVRVCDAYGSGYFYIPGTETCIQISGYVRTTYEHVKRDRHEDHEVVNLGNGSFSTFINHLNAGPDGEFLGKPVDEAGDRTVIPSNWTFGERKGLNDSKWKYRGRLNFNVKNETEYGTLSSELRIQGDGDGYSDGAYGVDRAIISIAGFRAGYGDTYWTTNHDYGAGNPAIADGFYNYDQGLFFDYTYTWEGFAVTGGVQQSQFGNDFDKGKFYDTANNTLDWYAGVNWSTDWATIAFTALSDNNAISIDHIVNAAGAITNAEFNTDSDTAYKVSAIVPFGDTSWKVGGWYAWEDNGNGRYVGEGSLLSGSNILAAAAQDKEWGVWVGGNLTDSFDIYGLYTEISGSSDNAVFDYKDITGVDSEIDGDKFKQWTVGANWKPVTGLKLQFEYTNEKRKADYGWGAQFDDKADIYRIRAVRSW